MGNMFWAWVEAVAPLALWSLLAPLVLKRRERPLLKFKLCQYEEPAKSLDNNDSPYDPVTGFKNSKKPAHA